MNPLLTKEPVDRGNEHAPSDVELAVRRLIAEQHEKKRSWTMLARFYGMNENTLRNVAYNRNFSIETAVKILSKHGKNLVIVDDTDNTNRTKKA